MGDMAFTDTGSFERLHGGSHVTGHTSGIANEALKSTSNRSQSHGMRVLNDPKTTFLDSKTVGHKHSSAGTPSKRLSDLATSTKRVASPTVSGPERATHKTNGRRASSAAQAENRLDRVPPSVSDQDLTEADHDPTPYCYCQKQSYGEMIGCDSDDCRYEWVSCFSPFT